MKQYKSNIKAEKNDHKTSCVFSIRMYFPTPTIGGYTSYYDKSSCAYIEHLRIKQALKTLK